MLRRLESGKCAMAKRLDGTHVPHPTSMPCCSAWRRFSSSGIAASKYCAGIETASAGCVFTSRDHCPARLVRPLLFTFKLQKFVPGYGPFGPSLRQTPANACVSENHIHICWVLLVVLGDVLQRPPVGLAVCGSDYTCTGFGGGGQVHSTYQVTALHRLSLRHSSQHSSRVVLNLPFGFPMSFPTKSVSASQPLSVLLPVFKIDLQSTQCSSKASEGGESVSVHIWLLCLETRALYLRAHLRAYLRAYLRTCLRAYLPLRACGHVCLACDKTRHVRCPW